MDAEGFVNQVFEEMAKDVNHDPNHSLTQLLTCLADVLKGAGGIWHPGEPSAVHHWWEGMGLDLPAVFPSKQCWQVQPSDHEFLSDLLDEYSQDEVDVYTSWDPHRPVPGSPISVVLEQLYVPHVATAFYASNMVSHRAKMCIPESYGGPPPYLESIQTTTNVTPCGTFVDLHVDMDGTIPKLESACAETNPF